MEKSQVSEGMLLGDATRGGSKCACSNVGNFFAKGSHSFAKGLKMARRYKSMVATASVKDLSDEFIEKAAAWLRDHPA